LPLPGENWLNRQAWIWSNPEGWFAGKDGAARAEEAAQILSALSFHRFSFFFSINIPHIGPRRDVLSDSDHLSVTLSVGTPLFPYGIAYRRVYGLSTSGLFKKSLCGPLCGVWPRPAESSARRNAGIRLTPELGNPPLQGYLAHKKALPPLGPP
jgi:hypothetical protein